MSQRTFVSVLFVTFIFASGALSQSTQVTIKDKFQAIQVVQFDVQQGIQLPPEYLPALQDAIIKKLQQSKQFKEVLRPGESSADAATAALRLTGTVTHFKQGSRAKRYLAGRLAGSTEIFAHVTLLDQATSQPVSKLDVQGVLAGGLFGGKSIKAANDFADNIVNSLKLILVQRLRPAEALAAPNLESPPTPADRHVVSISTKDFSGSEQKLNSEGAAGYRFVDFITHGTAAMDVTLEKSGNSNETYQYLVLHAHQAGTLQKNLDKAAEDGYRICPHAMAALGGSLAPQIAVVVSKLSSPGHLQFEYRIHRTMRLSSAQKDITKDESEGFLMVQTTELPGNGGHVVVMERQKENR